MAIPLESTFSYGLIVPDDWAESSGPWEMGSDLDPDAGSKRPRKPGLVGQKPRLVIEQLGPPDSSEKERRGPAIPSVNRARLKLSAGLLRRGEARSASFIVASELLAAARPGDDLSLRRDSGAGLSISILRNKELVVAAGALCSVPLGKRVRIFFPVAATEKAEAAFREVDPDFRFIERMLAIEVDSETRMLRKGRSDFGSYAVFVVSLGLGMGPTEVLGISDMNLCSPVAGSASAQLMAAYDLAIPAA